MKIFTLPPDLSPLKRELATPTGRLTEIADDTIFKGTVKFIELPESPLEYANFSDTTPSVLNIERLVFQNSGATTVTNFADGQEGQLIHVVGDGQTTLDNGTYIATRSGSDILLSSGTVYSFMFVNGVWREQGGAPVPNLSPLSTALSADVAMTVSSTWYSGPAVSLTAGTWLVVGHIQFKAATAADIKFNARLRDNATSPVSHASAETIVHNLNPNNTSLFVQALISASGALTVTLQGTTDTGAASTYIAAQTPDNAQGNTATIISAIKVA